MPKLHAFSDLLHCLKSELPDPRQPYVPRLVEPWRDAGVGFVCLERVDSSCFQVPGDRRSSSTRVDHREVWMVSGVSLGTSRARGGLCRGPFLDPHQTLVTAVSPGQELGTNGMKL